MVIEGSSIRAAADLTPGPQSRRAVNRLLAGRWVFGFVVLAAAGLALWLQPLPPLGASSVHTLLALSVAALAADVFTLDFPDRKRISGGYVFPLAAAALLAPGAGVLVAGVSGVVAGALKPQPLRSATFHGPRLAVAAGLAAFVDTALFGRVDVSPSAAGAVSIVFFCAIYTTVAWGLGTAEELLSGRQAAYPAVDLLNNLLLTPLPMALGVIAIRLGATFVQLSALALVGLQVIVRAYINLSSLHGELRGAYQRLAEQEHKLEQALETNREMSQIVSHDLRGPLTSVMGYAELLRGGLGASPLDPVKLRRYVDSVENNSRRILNLTDKLLDLHKLEQGGAAELGPVQLDRLLAQLLEEMQVRADQKGIALTLNLAPGLPPMTSCEWMVREVAENLMSNAIKYTPEGGRVAASAAPAGDFVELSVADSGIGMSSEDQGRLFTQFFRSGAREVRQQQGSGLGLALTKRMIEQLRGQVEVWSELGKGSRFTVRLPLQVEQP